MSRQPPESLMPLLHSIEEPVASTYQEHTRLADKDVEFVYEKLMDYFKLVGRGKDSADPNSSNSMRQALIDNILDRLEMREDIEADTALIESAFQPGGRPIPNVEMLYVMAFKYLLQSARFWRKNSGRAGYLKYISSSLLGK